MSLGVGLELVLIIEPEFGVWSCVTWSRNTQAEAAAVVNAAELPPMSPSEGHTQPAPYELDNWMDVMEDPIVKDPEASGVVLTDEQLAEELYGPVWGP